MSALIIQFSSRSDDDGLSFYSSCSGLPDAKPCPYLFNIALFSCSFPHSQLLTMMLSFFLPRLPPRKKENLRSHDGPSVETGPKTRNAIQEHLQRTMASSCTLTSLPTRQEVFSQVVQISF